VFHAIHTKCLLFIDNVIQWLIQLSLHLCCRDLANVAAQQMVLGYPLPAHAFGVRMTITQFFVTLIKQIMSQKDTLLKEIYYNPKHEAGFGSLKALVAASKLKRSDVEAWLRKQPTFTLHKRKRQHVKPLQPYRVSHQHVQFQADLVDYSKYVKWNRGYKFILMIMDIFSRKAWAFPLKSKRGKEVAEVLESLFSSIPTPQRLQVDEGKEFYNHNVQQVLSKDDIELFSIFSQYKCAHVERLNRTIKEKLEKIFTATNSRNWIDYLDEVMIAYNNTTHSTTKFKPNEVNKSNEKEVFENTMESRKPSKVNKKRKALPVGTRVRISRNKGTFGRGYEANWSTEEFFVHQVLTNPFGIPKYVIKDANGDIIRGSFYPQEVQAVDREEEIYQIDAILDTRRRRGRKEYLVHWQGYPTSMNSWVSESEMKELKGTRQY